MPRALVLVRNTVSHDGRVLREAHVLDDLGFDVLVAGIVSGEEWQTELDLDGVRVVRLVGPRQLVNGLLRRFRATGDHAPPGRERPSEAVAGRAGHLHRLLVTLAFNLQGIALVWRTSPDLVHANDYDTMWIGIAAKLLRRSRLVYDAHELWPDQDGSAGLRGWLIACEWLFLRLADATLTVSPGCAEVMARRYHVLQPVVIRNVPERIATPQRGGARRDPARPIAVYVGLLAPHRGLDEAVAALAAVPEVRLRLVGPDSGGFAAGLAERARTFGVLDRLEIRPPVPPAEVAEEIADADVGLVLIQPTSLSHRLSLPNKLFEYTAAGLPVIASDLPLLGPLVRDEGIGEVVPPGDIEAIAASLRRLADPTRNEQARARVRSFGERVNWQQEQLALEDVYRTALARRRSSAAS